MCPSQAELDSALDGLSGDFSSDPDSFYSAVNGAQFLDMVVAEALRMHMGQMIIRTCEKPYTIPGTEVKSKGEMFRACTIISACNGWRNGYAF